MSAQPVNDTEIENAAVTGKVFDMHCTKKATSGTQDASN